MTTKMSHSYKTYLDDALYYLECETPIRVLLYRHDYGYAYRIDIISIPKGCKRERLVDVVSCDEKSKMLTLAKKLSKLLNIPFTDLTEGWS